MNVQYQRHLVLGIAVTLALTGLLLVHEWRPQAAGIGAAPTGASFSLDVAAYRTAREAGVVAANIAATGLPAFTRTLRNGQTQQVIVGPYVSIDEAESAQRQLARRGFGRARMLVDESIRSSRPGAADGGPAGTGVVMVAAAGRLSVVLELPVEPRRVETRRPEGTVLEVDAGPVATGLTHHEWSAPGGVDLINQLSVERHEGLDGTSMRTRLVIPALTQNNVRVVGRRVYIDLWMPASRRDVPVQSSRTAAVDVRQPEERNKEEEMAAANPEDAYRDAVAPILARIAEIEPFLLSAASAPTPDVLNAVGKTLSGVDEWIRTLEPPAASAQAHAALVSGVHLAMQAVAPGFAGNREDQARAAIAAIPRPPR
jgi:hypothetical protein